MGTLDIGYHIMVDRDGCIHVIRRLDTVGCHTPGYNDESIGLCMFGGLDKDGKRVSNFTYQQRVVIEGLCCAFLHEYPLGRVVGKKELAGYKRKSDNPMYDMRALRSRLIERRIFRVPRLSELLKRGKAECHPKQP